MIWKRKNKTTPYLLLSLVVGLTMVLTLSACKKKDVDEPETSSTIVELDVSEFISSGFVGNGVQWSAYPEFPKLMTEEKWQTVFKRLDFMKPRLIRVMISEGWRYQTGDFQRNLEPLLKLLGYCQKNSIEVAFGEWGSGNNANILDNDFTDDEKWLDLAANYLEFLVKDHGMTCIKSYILINEPNGDWSDAKGNWGTWKRLVTSFHTRLVDKSLNNQIKIAGPDVAFFNNSTGTKSWVSDTYKELDDIIGVYNIHAYIGQEYVRSKSYSNFFKDVVSIPGENDKPFIMGELGFKYYDDKELDEENKARAEKDGYTAIDDCNMFVYDFFYGIDMADVCIQSMNVGFDGMVAWDLDDAMHSTGTVGGKPQLKRWGFWNILGSEIGNKPEDEAIRPWFYSWSLLCRYFPKGSQIIKSKDLGKKGLSYAVALHDGQYSIAVANTFYKEYDFMLKFDTTTQLNFKKYLYTEENRPLDENGFPTPTEYLDNVDMSKGIVIKSPAQSFMLYTSIKVE